MESVCSTKNCSNRATGNYPVAPKKLFGMSSRGVKVGSRCSSELKVASQDKMMFSLYERN
eukprot:3767362-Amphidinium_carterae.1